MIDLTNKITKKNTKIIVSLLRIKIQRGISIDLGIHKIEISLVNNVNYII